MLQDSNNDSIPKTDSDRNRNKKTSKYILCQGKIISGSTLRDKYKLHAEHISVLSDRLPLCSPDTLHHIRKTHMV